MVVPLRREPLRRMRLADPFLATEDDQKRILTNRIRTGAARRPAKKFHSLPLTARLIVHMLPQLAAHALGCFVFGKLVRVILPIRGGIFQPLKCGLVLFVFRVCYDFKQGSITPRATAIFWRALPCTVNAGRGFQPSKGRSDIFNFDGVAPRITKIIGILTPIAFF